MADDLSKYGSVSADTSDLSKYGAVQSDNPAPPAAKQPTIAPVPPPADLRERVSRWAQNVADDLRYGTDTTGVGSVLKAMGAHGLDVGVPEKVGEFMGSLPLGLLRATKGAAEITEPGQFTQGTKDIGGGALQAAEIPSLVSGGPEAAEAAPAVIKAASAAPELAERAATMIPSAERAGKGFSEVMSSAGEVPIDLSLPGDIALRTRDLSEAGGSMPKVIRDFIRRATDPDKGPLTYSEGRDFYSNATRVSADEAQRLTPIMRRQVAMFTDALNSSLERAADFAGKLDQYRDSMTEYHRAMQLRALGQGAKNAATSTAAKAVGATAAGAMGAYAVKKLFE